jgi:hypothetical protein
VGRWFAVKQTKGSSKMSNANQSPLNKNLAPQQNGKEQIDTAIASSDAFSSGFQAIATAYGDYTKKSFEDTKLFVEKLSGVKSLDKAIEVQTEFAKTAYETFVTESTEDCRTVQRSCQAVLQAIRWLYDKDDLDKSISFTPRCQSTIACSSRGVFSITRGKGHISRHPPEGQNVILVMLPHGLDAPSA